MTSEPGWIQVLFSEFKCILKVTVTPARYSGEFTFPRSQQGSGELSMFL